MKDPLPPNTTLSDPAPATGEEPRQLPFHLMLHTSSIKKLSRALNEVLDKLTFPEDVAVTVDVDSYQLL